MSQPPPPYAVRPSKPRPKRRWWVIGVLLLVSSGVVFGVGLWQTLSSATTTDGYVRTDGSPTTLQVPAGKARSLYVQEGQPPAACSVTDAGGTELPVTGSSMSTTVTIGSRVWVGVGRFTSETTSVTLRCSSATPGQEVRVGAALGGGFAAGIALTILGPMVLGLAGLAVLITTAVLWISRRPQPGAPTAPPPGPPSPPPPAW